MVFQTNVNLAAKEGPGRQHHGRRQKFQSHLGDDALDGVTVDDQIIRRLLKNTQIRLVFELVSDGAFVQRPIRLGTGRAHRRPFA